MQNFNENKIQLYYFHAGTNYRYIDFLKLCWSNYLFLLRFFFILSVFRPILRDIAECCHSYYKGHHFC
jgi:hypothetical protein